MTTILNQNIGQAFDRELASMLRRRFLWLCGTWITFTVLFYLWKVARPVFGFMSGTDFSFEISGFSQLWVFFFGELVRLAILGGALWLVYRRCRTQRGILRVAFWTLILIGLSCIAVRIDPDHPLPGPLMTMVGAETGWAGWSPVISSATSIAMAHLFMCMFLPWTPSQAARPLFILAPIWIAAAFGYEGFSERFVIHGLILAPILSSIGLFICWVRNSQMWENVETNVLRRHFNEAQRELIDARRIHESRFPSPLTSGPVCMSYFYEPMLEIGGDFLHARRDNRGTLYAALIDVTGHGITAALAVNRIDGELARLIAENPLVPPDELLELLNRYIHLTMARHSLYATAFCLSLTPDGSLLWANAGHPPAFVRRQDGSIESLESTTFMLGACPAPAFDAGAEQCKLSAGDTIVVYTDGACEAMDARGRQFGVRGLRQALEKWQPNSDIDILPFLPETVRNYRVGAPQDDVLFTIVRLGNEQQGTTN